MSQRASPRPPSAPPLLRPDFVRIVVAHALSALGWSSMLLLPVYLSAIGASRAEIGAVMASAALTGLAVRPLVGVGLDRWGRRPVIALGTLLQAGGMAAILAVDAVDWRPYAARALFGLGTAAVFTGYFTFATDLIPLQRRTEGIALFGISGLVPLVINPAAQALGVQASELRWFLPLTAVVLLGSLVPLLAISEPERSGVGAPSARAVMRAMVRAPLRPVWTATLALATLVVVFQAFSTVAAGARGIARPADVWLSYAVGAIAIRAFGARLPDRLGTRNLVAPGLAALAAGALVLATAQSRGALLLAGLLGGLGHGIGFPVLTSQVATRSPLAMRGSALAGFTGLWDCAFLAAPPLLGLLADRWGDAAMLSLTGAGAAAALALWAVGEALVGDDRSPDAG
jgi:MFS family permease